MTTYRDAQMEAQAEFHAHEMDVGDSRWERLARRLRADLGFSLDGDNSEEAKSFFCADGFSLDETYEMFERGDTYEAIRDAILSGAEAAGQRTFGAGLDALCDAQERAQADGKTDYAEQLGKVIDRLADDELAAASAAERAFGC